jgi:hypothetical protein
MAHAVCSENVVQASQCLSFSAFGGPVISGRMRAGLSRGARLNCVLLHGSLHTSTWLTVQQCVGALAHSTYCHIQHQSMLSQATSLSQRYVPLIQMREGMLM